LLKCIDKDESNRVMNDLHKGVCGGHQYWKETTFKILRVGYYWPTLFSDVFANIKACEKCQMFAGKIKLLSVYLNTIISNGPFQQWGLNS
jgi:hypothetical protein